MSRGARLSRKPHSNMVAVEWLPTGNSAPPFCAVPHLPSQVPHRIGTYADAVTPGLALGDPSWTLVLPFVPEQSIPSYYATFAETRGRPLTSHPTIPYRDETLSLQPHGLGLSLS